MTTDEAAANAVTALSLARAGLEGRDQRYLQDASGSEDGSRDGYDLESQALIEGLQSQGWKLTRIADLPEPRSAPDHIAWG